MIANTLLLIGAALPFIGFALIALIWWPHRKTGKLSSAPWICITLAYWMLSPIWMRSLSNNFQQAVIHKSENLGSTIFNHSVAIMFVSPIPLFLITLMLVINGAFLLDGTHTGRFQAFMARQHPLQTFLGLLLLFFAVAPLLITLCAIRSLAR